MPILSLYPEDQPKSPFSSASPESEPGKLIEPSTKSRAKAPDEHNQMALDLCDAMAMIHRRGWCDGTGGNFSCVIQREPLLLLMAPSGVDKGSVAPDALIEVDGNARVVGGQGKASAETLLHLAIVQGTGAGAVLHTHSQAGTLLSQWVGRTLPSDQHDPAKPAGGAEPENPPSDREHVTEPPRVALLAVKNLEMLKGLAGVTTHQSCVQIPVLANDQNLQRLSIQAAPHLASAPHGLLIAGHGLYAWGQDLMEAKRHLEILEFLLEQCWRQLLLDALYSRQDQAAASIGP